jgi:hypothetical protein
MASWLLGVFGVQMKAESETSSGLPSGGDEDRRGESASDFNADEF